MGKKKQLKILHVCLVECMMALNTVVFTKNSRNLAEYSGVPVWNGLTDEDHPTQVLADFLTTAKEVLKKIMQILTLLYWSYGRNNVANALMQGAAIMGMNPFSLSKELNPTDELLNRCKNIAAENGGNILITDDIDQGKGSDVIYTDVWVSWVNLMKYGKNDLNY